MADAVDPQVRLQNIALEHAELMARRSMNWGETTNRTMMFMTVVGAAVVGLALLAQTSSGRDLALLALLVLSIVLLIGLTTFLRLTQLDTDDMRLIQGLNRLRHLRQEIDPGLAPYLVTSSYDDFDSILQAYAPKDASWLHGFATLVVLVLIVNCVLVGVVAGLVAVNLEADATMSVIAGVAAAVVFAVVVSIWLFREVSRVGTRFVALVPAPPDVTSPSPEEGREPVRPVSSTD